MSNLTKDLSPTADGFRQPTAVSEKSLAYFPELKDNTL